MLNLRRLEHFAVIAEEKSFLKAALRLNLTQPALTRSIQTLEDSLGLLLFNRAQEGVNLTDAGQRLLPRALRMLGDAENLRREARQLVGMDRGHVNFGVGVFPAEAFLTRVLIEQVQEKPGLTVDVDIGNWQRLRSKLERNELDFVVALTHSLPPPADFVVHPLPPQRFGFFVRHGHPLLGLDERSQRMALRQYKLIGPLLPLQARQSLTEVYQLDSHEELPIGMSCDSVAVLQKVMLESDCVLFATHEALPVASLQDSFAVLPHVRYAAAEPLATALIHAQGRVLSPAAVWLIGKIEQVLRLNADPAEKAKV
ncbi:LysR family transcriptional regulator [Limnohabitans lacus]|jgi:DNA-binding transcriptional LysR family regulator|uniref:LysR family transcriptional regulator n=1 Tax=Limnohabitans lacus TaxID=3045173 RepID=A0ABT6X9J3_9BURK|nr:LysR family transcriptional regulator [Limnohabitans sp. HM2-2]MDI9234785.1 LysR family transcriptional regulator [Limnohabitans sp. HM2-2]